MITVFYTKGSDRVLSKKYDTDDRGVAVRRFYAERKDNTWQITELRSARVRK